MSRDPFAGKSPRPAVTRAWVGVTRGKLTRSPRGRAGAAARVHEGGVRGPANEAHGQSHGGPTGGGLTRLRRPLGQPPRVQAAGPRAPCRASSRACGFGFVVPTQLRLCPRRCDLSSVSSFSLLGAVAAVAPAQLLALFLRVCAPHARAPRAPHALPPHLCSAPICIRRQARSAKSLGLLEKD